MDEFSFWQIVQRALDRWWWGLLLALLGAGLGWGANFFLPPVYDAAAQISIYLDPAQTGSLTEYEIDYAYHAAGQVIAFNPIIVRVVERAREELNLPLTAQQFHDGMGLERRHETWFLHIRDSDPQFAASLANLWADEAYQWLTEARRRAQRAAVLRTYLEALASCPQPAPADPALPAICTAQAAPDPAALEQLQQQLASESAASYTVSAALLISRPEPVVLPFAPVQGGAGTLMLAGALLGFASGALLSLLRLPQRAG